MSLVRKALADLSRGLGDGGLAQAVVATISFLALAVFLFALSWNSEYAGYHSDDAFYLLVADGFSPYRHVDSDLTRYAMSQSLFPPLYPLLLAVFGGGGGDLLVSHWITTATLLAALLVLGFWARFETERPWLAIWLASIFALLPGTLLLDLQIFSEFPYLLLTLLALWLARRGETSAWNVSAIALCVGLAAITRSAGVSLILAMGAWLFCNRVRGRERGLAIVLALAPSVVWFAYQSRMTSQPGYGSAWHWLWEMFRDYGALQFFLFLAAQCKGLWWGLLANLDLRSSSWLAGGVLISTLLIGLPVWVGRLRHGCLDALYLLIAIPMILLWPYPNVFDRLLFPLLPVLLLYGCLGVLCITSTWQQFNGRPVVAWSFLGVWTLMLLPSTGFIAHRLNEPIAAELTGWKHTHFWYQLDGMDRIVATLRYRGSLVRAASELQRWVPEGECVYGVHIALDMLYGRRIVRQPPEARENKPFEELPKACRFFFLVNRGGQIGNFGAGPFYPRERLPADRIETLHVWEDAGGGTLPTAILVRVKPSA